MSQDRFDAIVGRLLAARQKGTRIARSDPALPANYAEGFAIQERVVQALASPIIGWKVMQVPQGPVIYAPILGSGLIAAGGTWEVVGNEPAGIELEIAFRMGRDVPPDAGRNRLLEAVADAHVVFELCQSRIAEPSLLPRHVMLADCIANAGVVVGDAIANWGALELAARAGQLLVDGELRAEGKSGDPLAALALLPPALRGQGKALRAGDIVITGSLIGMHWFKGRHQLKGSIDGCGEVAMRLIAAEQGKDDGASARAP
jgi:2-keto-4-pentenoate hydratase